MNRTGQGTARQKTNSSTKGNNDRELFVTTDYQTIPVGELRPLTGSLTTWVSAVVSHKILRSKSPTHFAIEAKRLVNGDAEHVPKRIMKRFSELRSQLERLNFGVSFYATIPSVGPFAKAVMGMSQTEGPDPFLGLARRQQNQRRSQGRRNVLVCHLAERQKLRFDPFARESATSLQWSRSNDRRRH